MHVYRHSNPCYTCIQTWLLPVVHVCTREYVCLQRTIYIFFVYIFDCFFRFSICHFRYDSNILVIIVWLVEVLWPDFEVVLKKGSLIVLSIWILCMMMIVVFIYIIFNTLFRLFSRSKIINANKHSTIINVYDIVQKLFFLPLLNTWCTITALTVHRRDAALSHIFLFQTICVNALSHYFSHPYQQLYALQ